MILLSTKCSWWWIPSIRMSEKASGGSSHVDCATVGNTVKTPRVTTNAITINMSLTGPIKQELQVSKTETSRIKPSGVVGNEMAWEGADGNGRPPMSWNAQEIICSYLSWFNSASSCSMHNSSCRSCPSGNRNPILPLRECLHNALSVSLCNWLPCSYFQVD